MCVMSASVVGKVYCSPTTYLLGFQGIGPKISNNSLANLAILANLATLAILDILANNHICARAARALPGTV